MRLALLIAAFTLFTSPLHAEVRWTLDCKVDKVGTLRLKGVEGDGDYAYLCLTVTNNTRPANSTQVLGTYFGEYNATRDPRIIQLGVKLYF